MTNAEQALKTLTEKVQKQQATVDATVDPLGLKIGEALRSWFETRMESYVEANAEKFVELGAEKVAELKKKLMSTAATWPDAAQELVKGRYGLAGDSDKAALRRGSVTHIIKTLGDHLLQDTAKIVSEELNVQVTFSLSQSAVLHGGLPKSFDQAIRVQLEDFQAAASKLKELEAERDKWAKKVAEEKARELWK